MRKFRFKKGLRPREGDVDQNFQSSKFQVSEGRPRNYEFVLCLPNEKDDVKPVTSNLKPSFMTG
jgi:hypothetical protein